MTPRIVTLSFDDGFALSFPKIAAIYEEFGLRACLNVCAGLADDVEHGLAPPPHDAGGAPYGGWTLWNELAARGHEIMPHGWRHANHTKLSPEESRRQVEQTLASFEANLTGFRRQAAVFNFPYNAFNAETIAALRGQVRAWRGGGRPAESAASAPDPMGINPLPSPATWQVFTTGFGPPACDEHLERCVAALLARESGWLVYNGHGLDGEGWGPMGSDFLRRLLDRLLRTPGVAVLPAGVALRGAKERDGDGARGR